ncbi:LysR family transcriptional regulator [Tsukamurella ocularis]|uniref:LysR family transcriptional regulator n=1 Tax=Tsukamurella ocularis TaxID=1970234 RepID=UPI0039EE2B1E
MNTAARAHGIAQSTVTRYVAATERELGFALFERGPGGASPAPAGLPALAVIERIVAELDQLDALSGAAEQSVTISRTAEIGLPDHLEGKVARWNPGTRAADPPGHRRGPGRGAALRRVRSRRRPGDGAAPRGVRDRSGAGVVAGPAGRTPEPAGRAVAGARGGRPPVVARAGGMRNRHTPAPRKPP